MQSKNHSKILGTQEESQLNLGEKWKHISELSCCRALSSVSTKIHRHRRQTELCVEYLWGQQAAGSGRNHRRNMSGEHSHWHYLD